MYHIHYNLCPYIKTLCAFNAIKKARPIRYDEVTYSLNLLIVSSSEQG